VTVATVADLECC